MTPVPDYQAARLFMIRVPALPLETVLNLLESCSTAGEPPFGIDCRSTLTQLWQCAEVAEPLREASPAVAAALDNLETLSAKDQRRALRTLFRYTIRMSCRPTPFGALAAVATGRFGDGSDLRLSGRRTAVDRLDARWLTALAEPLVGTYGLPRELPLAANALLRSTEGHVWLEAAGAAAGAVRADVVLSSTGAVGTVLRHAAVMIRAGDLIGAVLAEHPGTPRDTVITLLSELLRARVLVTPRALGSRAHTQMGMIANLRSKPTEDMLIAEAAEILAELPHQSGSRAEPCARLRKIASQLTPQYDGPLLHTDTVVQFVAEPQLPDTVRGLASQAATDLTTIGTFFQYPPRLCHYALAFAARYGTAAEIPLIEVMSPTAGIGLPDGYQRSGRPEPSSDPGRQAFLIRIMERALIERSIEVRLTDTDYAELAEASAGADTRPLMPALDVNLRLADPHGRTAVVTGVGLSPTGRAFGRFSHLFDAAALDELAEVSRTEERGSPGDLHVELRYLARPTPATNVVAHATVRKWELPVNVAPTPGAHAVLGASDILMGLHASKFYFRSARSGRRLLFVQSSMIDPSKQAAFPRLLMEVSSSQFRFAPRFDWGALEGSPFLPRVAIGDVVLRRAEWRVRTADLGALESMDGSEYARRVAAWQERWMVARWVQLVSADGELLLDLHSPLSLAELRDAIRAAGPGGARVVECLPSPSDDAIAAADPTGRHYAFDVIVPVHLRTPVRQDSPKQPPVLLTRRGAAADTGSATREQRFGSNWLSLHVHAAPVVHDRLLTGEVAALFNRLRDHEVIDQYHFVRFPDPSWHLRIRLHAAGPDAERELFSVAGAWCRGLAQGGETADITCTTYRREIERYGGFSGIDMAEGLFTLDSGLVLAILDSTAILGRLGRVRATALVLERIARPLISDCQARYAFLPRTTSGAHEYRSCRPAFWQAANSADAGGLWPSATAHAWLPAAQAYAARLAHHPETREGAIRGLFHMHCNRMGLNRLQEQAVYGIWRRLLDRCAHGPERHRMCMADPLQDAAPGVLTVSLPGTG